MSQLVTAIHMPLLGPHGKPLCQLCREEDCTCLEDDLRLITDQFQQVATILTKAVKLAEIQDDEIRRLRDHTQRLEEKVHRLQVDHAVHHGVY